MFVIILMPYGTKFWRFVTNVQITNNSAFRIPNSELVVDELVFAVPAVELSDLFANLFGWVFRVELSLIALK